MGLLLYHSPLVRIMNGNYEELLKMWRDGKKQLSEVKEDNKKLVQQVEDQREISRGHQRQNGKLHVELKESQKKECKCNTKTSTSS